MNVTLGSGKAVHYSATDTSVLPECGGNRASERYRRTDKAVTCKRCIKIMDAEASKGEEIEMVNNESVEIDNTLAEALEGVETETDPTAATIDQIKANIERAVSLAEAENAEGLAELSEENETLISSLPQRGRYTLPGEDKPRSWADIKKTLRGEWREASQSKPKPESSKAVAKAEKAEAAVPDYSKFEGVKDRITEASKLVVSGVKLNVKMAQTAREAATMFLDGQRRITRPDGLPDLATETPEAIQARKDMFENAREILAQESGDADHAKRLVDKFRTAVKNQLSDVRVQMIRALDDSPEEFAEHYAKIAELKPELAELKPSEQVFNFYGISPISKRELMNQRNAEKAAKLKELEAAASEGDPEAAEKIEEIKTETVAQRVATKFQTGDKAIREALREAKTLTDDDKAALKAKIMELVALASEL